MFMAFVQSSRLALGVYLLVFLACESHDLMFNLYNWYFKSPCLQILGPAHGGDSAMPLRERSEFQQSSTNRDRPSTRPMRTLLLSNLLDVDEETICFWVRCLLDVWPHSVQIFSDDEKAIVKISDDCQIGNTFSCRLATDQSVGITVQFLSPTTVPRIFENLK